MKPNLFSILGTMIKAQKFKVLLRIIYSSFFKRHPFTACFLSIQTYYFGQNVGLVEGPQVVISFAESYTDHQPFFSPRHTVCRLSLLQVINLPLLICQAMVELILILLQRESELQHKCTIHYSYYFIYALCFFACSVDLA